MIIIEAFLLYCNDAYELNILHSALSMTSIPILYYRYPCLFHFLLLSAKPTVTRHGLCGVYVCDDTITGACQLPTLRPSSGAAGSVL